MKNAGVLIAEKHSDSVGAKIGMWLFLFTELLLFGGMFLLYAVYRTKHPQEFHLSASELDTFIGTMNTLILLTSSLTVALSIEALQRANRKLAILMLSVTIILGLAFLMNKYFEWSVKIHHGIYPGSPELLNRGQGETLFFGLYYTMTGLHGLHVLVGVVVLTVMLIMIAWQPASRSRAGNIDRSNIIKLENSGLYWHLVDVIWIFLFPLFYLIT